jgi:VPDSG-CTERM motif
MKINLIPTRKLALLCTALAGALLAFTPNAKALTIGDTHELGFVNFGIPSSEQNRAAYINHLITMGLGTSDQTLGQTFFRSNNNFGPLPTAVVVGPTVTFQNPPTTVSINIGTGLYTYLFAKYDGPNYGSEVWYIGDLSGTITIPGFAGRYGLSGYTLFGPGTPGVPDGGTTAMLLGAALSVLGVARRYIMS